MEGMRGEKTKGTRKRMQGRRNKRMNHQSLTVIYVSRLYQPKSKAPALSASVNACF
ncbi:MAG: hypothetical protein LBL13_00445 [Bacteroidales bacterium]|nr:hypothetical protein [Bacteroidales bacterium]